MESQGGNITKLEGEFKCNTCGTILEAKLPMTFDEYKGKMSQLVKEHKNCINNELKEIDKKVGDVCDG